MDLVILCWDVSPFPFQFEKCYRRSQGMKARTLDLSLPVPSQPKICSDRSPMSKPERFGESQYCSRHITQTSKNTTIRVGRFASYSFCFNRYNLFGQPMLSQNLRQIPRNEYKRKQYIFPFVSFFAYPGSVDWKTNKQEALLW